ncbi:unnamed protein product [Rotaria magnacalcarata]|uniref:Uncharacterized protein n=2 Tax=Rotaria magnacalcarata TaxID=392030 RepID=A0A816L2W0_9BILA|nr:unnamed protein product [Rotaria magnacalcarata]CAF2113281.1 unnamed protein product [Rotaria magnacalcarata]
MPFAMAKRQKPHSTQNKQSECLNICKFVLARLPTIAFGTFTVSFTLQQDVSTSTRPNREQGERKADETNRCAIFKEYIDDMKGLLLDESCEQNINKSLLQIQIQTVTLLKHLDTARKLDIIGSCQQRLLQMHS